MEPLTVKEIVSMFENKTLTRSTTPKAPTLTVFTEPKATTGLANNIFVQRDKLIQQKKTAAEMADKENVPACSESENQRNSSKS